MAAKYFQESQVLYEQSTVKFQLCFTKDDPKGESYKLVSTSPETKLCKLDAAWNVQTSMKKDVSGQNKSLLKFIISLSIKNPMISDSKLFSLDIAINGYDYSLCSFNVVNCRISEAITSPGADKIEFNDKSFDTSLGCITITANLRIMFNRKVKKSLESVALNDHWSSMMAYNKLLEFTELCDFTFIVQNEKFKVHKVCAAAASEVMRTMFTTGFDESRTNSTVITDINPKAFEIFIYFMYGDKKNFIASFTDDLVFEVFKVAHKYDVKKLEHFCMARIFEKFTSIDQILDTYAFACVYDIEDNLKKYCWEIIQYDILKLFTPLDPAPIEVVLEYIENIKNLKDEVVTKCHSYHENFLSRLNVDVKVQRLDYINETFKSAFSNDQKI